MWRWIFTHHLFAVLPSCSLNEYVCASGGCVSASLRCDGHDNCLDSSDEVSPLARPSHLTSSAPLSETVHKCSRETKTKTCTSRYIGKRFKRDTTSHYKTSLEKEHRSKQIKVDKLVSQFKLKINMKITQTHSASIIWNITEWNTK